MKDDGFYIYDDDLENLNNNFLAAMLLHVFRHKQKDNPNGFQMNMPEITKVLRCTKHMAMQARRELKNNKYLTEEIKGIPPSITYKLTDKAMNGWESEF